MTPPIIQRREPALVLVLSIVTLGIYLPFWYHGVYEDLQTLDGRTPTGHGFWLDFLFVILTFAIYGIWVDYQISQQIAQFEERNGLGPVQDTSIIAIILDVASYFTAFFTNFVTSAIQQDQINRIVEKLEARLTSDAGVPA
ncbi:MAG: DUF4234 domain-containing protein [Deltaproteobacteria bacterium]|jgi:hypothetical protein|nr:DUF4234 domain-containing protein [Deltaproteobacteria bacterium]MBW1875021.1 DUF4234 domain-containing protein [Deltaproteobacteria bacterium]MBW2210973.1 DUF4234 domain-containing protein [Deltaproteobacteria bacterium]MBW2213452.1 DUF4234 domain-containing protein [Deltaproteobacteria bacterium]MBW2379065.1 DUF4234 domain-containing protein [Deltaproteobacteria bacterium]